MKKTILLLVSIILLGCSENNDSPEEFFTHEIMISDSRGIKIVTYNMLPDDAISILNEAAKGILNYKERDINPNQSFEKSDEPKLEKVAFNDIYYWDNYNIEDIHLQTYVTAFRSEYLADYRDAPNGFLISFEYINGTNPLKSYDKNEHEEDFKRSVSKVVKGSWKSTCLGAYLYSSIAEKEDRHYLKSLAQEVRTLTPGIKCNYLYSNNGWNDYLPEGYIVKY